jgi:small conductance mechanosensitive channel
MRSCACVGWIPVRSEVTGPAVDWRGLLEQFAAFIESPLGLPVKLLGIVLVALLVRLVLQVVINRVVNRVVTGVKKRQNVDDTRELSASPIAAARIIQRTRALGGVLSSAVTTVVVIVVLVLVIAAIDPNATGAFALITAALGAGLGFGAQNLIRDVLAGLFIVAEDQLGVGDVVDLGSATGTVEAVGIRITTVRDVDGTLWYVRNGEILRVGNKSQGWARAVLDIPLPYTADVAAVRDRILEVAGGLRDDPKWKRFVLERPEVWGVENLTGDAVVLRLTARTRPSAKDDVARELRARVKQVLDELGVRIPAAAAPGPADGAPSNGTSETPVIPGVVKAPPRGGTGGKR